MLKLWTIVVITHLGDDPLVDLCYCDREPTCEEVKATHRHLMEHPNENFYIEEYYDHEGGVVIPEVKKITNYKIQAIYADGQWRDLVDSETNKPELFSDRDAASSEVDDLVGGTSMSHDELRLVDENEPSPA